MGLPRSDVRAAGELKTSCSCTRQRHPDVLERRNVLLIALDDSTVNVEFSTDPPVGAR
jgi:hypothetical protein